MDKEEEVSEVAVIGLTSELVKHQKIIDIMDLAERVVHRNCLRHNIDDLHKATEMIDKVVVPLSRTYDRMKEDHMYDLEYELHIPDVSNMSLEQLIEMKSQLGKGVSAIDKAITAVRSKES